MSTVVHEIDALLSTLRDELAETRAHLRQISPNSKRELKRHQGLLARTRQRIESLETLRQGFARQGRVH
jgi:hypothetical protein